MINRKCVIMLLIIFILSMVSCSENQNIQLQTISIDGCGSIDIPAQWQLLKDSETVCFTDHKGDPVLIQTFSWSGMDDDMPGIQEYDNWGNSIRNLKTLTSAVFSNGAIYGKVLMEINAQQVMLYYLEIGDEDPILLVFTDASVSKALVESIAKSFVSTNLDL